MKQLEKLFRQRQIRLVGIGYNLYPDTDTDTRSRSVSVSRYNFENGIAYLIARMYRTIILRYYCHYKFLPEVREFWVISLSLLVTYASLVYYGVPIYHKSARVNSKPQI